jgi:hypothetical protein
MLDLRYLVKTLVNVLRDAYPSATLARLAAVKQAYDPTNLFRLNLNVRPKG